MLYFVGFNAYKQFPNNDEKDSSKVVQNWRPIHDEEVENIYCTHRFVAVKKVMTFTLFGLVTCGKEQPMVIAQPTAIIDSFGSNDNCLIASWNTSLWKYVYKDSKWVALDVHFVGNDKSCWYECGNKVVKISFRDDISSVILLLSNGSVWTLGKNNVLKLLYSYEVDKAIDLCSGIEHTLILTESGCVLAFGNGSRGQLGTGNLESIDEPVQIPTLVGIKINKISAGHWHSCAVTESGDLCTWGWNNYGQLGVFEDGKEVGLTSLPMFVDLENNEENWVVDVACGSRHTMAKVESGDLYATGWNGYSQLGIQSTISGSCSEKIFQFTLTDLKENQNRKLFAGPWYTIVLDNPPENKS